ncbi:TPA: type 1 fimbrial protein [Klebsiella pneumoniae]|nr:type 1 fimbrial protein [Klebsiella pneumoniae]HBQ2948519.1 type 1 fimbrial protein [Klebsiella pneumoniae]
MGWLLAGLLTASASLRAADVTLTVNGKVVARPCTVSTVNATVELGDLYTFSLIGAGSASAWHSVALDLSNCPVGTSRVKATFSGTADSTVSLGTVGTSPVNLGLTATYARTTGQVTAGNVQSIIGITFVYQ